jgi:cleavage and polyadenylation specificity factor subunit 1
MHAFHQTLLPASAIHHSLFLPNFTPSTIYPLPRPHTEQDEPEVKVIGNLIVAGGEDLRVFEIRELLVPLLDVQKEDTTDIGDVKMDDVGDGFMEGAHVDVCVTVSHRCGPTDTCSELLCDMKRRDIYICYANITCMEP